jgi:tripartite-type tricarboxylate transporter receptor subunit TctC
MKKILTSTFAVLVALTMPAVVHAQGWPTKTVSLVVPFPPGGSTDTVARAIGPKLTEKLGRSFIVDNKAGATGTIGVTFVKRAAPDGHNLLVTSLGPLVIAPHLIRGLQYDPQKDFDFITVAVQAPNVLVVPASSRYKTVGSLVAYEKLNPGKMFFASSGNGSSDHLTAELFWQQTGTRGTHVPYKGGAPAITDLLGSQVDASFQNINAVIQHIKSGKLRALAITSARRSALLPEVPTLNEAGVKDLEVYSWQAVVAPKGLPSEVREKTHAAMVAALNDPQVKKQFEELGFQIVANTPAQFAAFQQKESARWKKVIEDGKITAE